MRLYNKKLDFDFGSMSGAKSNFASKSTDVIIDEIERIEHTYKIKFRILKMKIQEASQKFVCYFSNKTEFTNYHLPMMLCDIFKINQFDPDKRYQIVSSEYWISYLEALSRLASTNEFVSPIHVHYRTRFNNKTHPGSARLSLCNIDLQKDKDIMVVVTDYNNNFTDEELFTHRLIRDENLFYSGLTIRNYDQPCWEFFEYDHLFIKPEITNARVEYINYKLSINDVAILNLQNDKVNFYDRDTAYKTLDEYKSLVKKRM